MKELNWNRVRLVVEKVILKHTEAHGCDFLEQWQELEGGFNFEPRYRLFTAPCVKISHEIEQQRVRVLELAEAVDSFDNTQRLAQVPGSVMEPIPDSAMKASNESIDGLWWPL